MTEQLEDIFSHRADHLLPLLVTTNLDPREISPVSRPASTASPTVVVLG